MPPASISPSQLKITDRFGNILDILSREQLQVLAKGQGKDWNSDLERKGLFWMMFWEIQIIVEKAQSLGQVPFARNMRQQLTYILTDPEVDMRVEKQGHLQPSKVYSGGSSSKTSSQQTAPQPFRVAPPGGDQGVSLWEPLQTETIISTKSEQAAIHGAQLTEQTPMQIASYYWVLIGGPRLHISYCSLSSKMTTQVSPHL